MKRCVRCGKPFLRGLRSYFVHAVQRYCSRECSAAARRLPEKACANPHCAKLYRPRKHTQLYCSPRCGHAARSVETTTRTCAGCGAAFERRDNEAVQDFVRRRFCSFACGQKRARTPKPAATPHCTLKDCAWVLTTPGATRCTPGDGSPVCIRRQAEMG